MSSTRPQHPSDPGTPAPNPVNPGHGRERVALRWGIGISVVAHLFLLALYPLVMDRLTHELPEPVRDEPVTIDRAMEVVMLLELDPEEAELEPDIPVVPVPEPDPEPEPDPVDPVVAPPPTPPVAPPPEPPVVVTDPDAERRSVADLLRPRAGDPRLWAPLTADYLDLTDQERAQLLLHGMLRNWNDSMAVAQALAGAATDWTYTDDEGRRWGLSPGRLHLGDYSIPLPVVFEPPPWVRNEWAQRQWIYDDIARGAMTHQMRETWAERAQEIRRRMDEERARQRGGGDGG